VPKRKKAGERLSFPVSPYVKTLLYNIGDGKTAVKVRKGQKVFSQGELSDSIFFIESGRVKISVISSSGREAVVAILGPPSFFGEGCMVAQPVRLGTATALEQSTLFRVEKRAMLRALSEQPTLSEKFIASLLTRNLDLEEDLCDQLFNHSEKRLARVLIKLERLRNQEKLSDGKIPVLSHETLAEMVGTTRARITHFLNKFRKLGLIDYNGDLHVRVELLTDAVLND